jgi:hypothetical protein
MADSDIIVSLVLAIPFISMIEVNRNPVNFSKIVKFQNHLEIVKNDKL